MNLVKTPEQVADEDDAAMEDQEQMALTEQAGQLASSPLMDPTKNTQLLDQTTPDA